MSNIPTKGDLAKQQADAAEARRKAAIPAEIKAFTDQIVAAMARGDRALSLQMYMPSPEAQAQLTADFQAQGWTLTFNPARTGGSISWK